MSSVLILSRRDEGVPLALELKREGHIVRIFSSECSELFIDEPNPSRITYPGKMLEQFDLILSTTLSIQEMIEEWEKRVIGAGRLHVKLRDESYLSSVRESLLPETVMTSEESGFARVYITGWMTVGGLLPTYLLTLPYTRLTEGERGPVMNAGTVHRLLEMNKLYEWVLKPLESLLKKVGLVGPISAHCFLSESACFVQMLSGQLQSSILQGLHELYKPSLFSLFWALQSGERIELGSEEYSMCVTLSQSSGEQYDLQPHPDALSHVWVQSQKGTSFLLGSVSARGVSIKECRRRVKRTLDHLSPSQDVMFRNDIGEDAEERFMWLKEAGWLT